jgi:hypothetical protein
MSSKSVAQLPEHLKKSTLLDMIEKANITPKSPMEALSLIIHAIMKQLTFRFVGCGDSVNEQGNLDT